MGRSSRRTGKLSTRGCGRMAKAPSLRKARTRGTQRTRKLSTGKALWSWRNGKERFVRARRETAGAKPYTMKVVRTVFNGGHEETYGNATRLVPTQRECDKNCNNIKLEPVIQDTHAPPLTWCGRQMGRRW